MSRVDSYTNYQNNYYDTIQSKRNQSTTKAGKKENATTAKTEKAGNQAQVQLSNRAQELLEKLKKKYSNMDFMVAEYEGDDEAAEYLSRGTKDYSVLIEPELLEKMAADEDTEKKYVGIIEGATEQFEEMNSELGKDIENVKTLGFTVKEDGTTTLFADLEKMGDQQKERIEKARAEKKEKTDTQSSHSLQAYQKKPKTTRVYADTIAELVDKIKNVDWYKINADDEKENGHRIDYNA